MLSCKANPQDGDNGEDGNEGNGDNGSVGEVTVYTAGYYSNGTHDIAAYWIDDAKNDLTDGSVDARANSIFLYGSDVYVTGYEGSTGNEVACYWKNGTKTKEFTTDSPEKGEAESIWVNATGVYVSGYYTTSDPLYTAWYWDGAAGTARFMLQDITMVRLRPTGSTELKFPPISIQPGIRKLLTFLLPARLMCILQDFIMTLIMLPHIG